MLDITSATTVPATALHIYTCLATPLMKLRSDQFRNARARRHRRQPTSEKSRLRTVRPAHQPRRFKTNGHLPNDVGRNLNGWTIALSCSYYMVKAWPLALYAICTTCATCSSAGGGGSSGSGSGNGSGGGSGSGSTRDTRAIANWIREHD